MATGLGAVFAMDIRNLAYSFFARGFATLCTAITLLVTAWYFGATGRGALAATTSLVAIISTVIGCSIGRNLARNIQISELGGKGYIGENLPGIIRAMGLIILVAWIVIGVCGVAGGEWLGELRWYHLVAGALWVPYYVWAQFAEAIYAGLDQVRYYNSWQAATALVAVGFAFIGGAMLQGHLVLFMIVFGALLLVSTGCEIWWVHARFGRRGENRYRLHTSIAAAGYLHLDTVGALLFASAGTLIVNKTDGFSGAGAFETAAKLSAMWALIAIAVRTNLLARSAQVGVEVAWRSGRRFVLMCIALSAGLALIGAKIFGQYVEAHFRGFEGWAVYFLMFSSISILSSLPTILSPLFIAKGWAKYMGLGTFMLGCFNLALMWWLTPLYGVIGALVALWTTYLIAFLINISVAQYLDSVASHRRSVC